MEKTGYASLKDKEIWVRGLRALKKSDRKLGRLISQLGIIESDRKSVV